MEKNINNINLKTLIFGAVPQYDEMGRFSSIELRFHSKDRDTIYTKSYLTKFEVAKNFSSLRLKLDAKQFLRFATTLAEGVSSYLYNIRFNLVGEAHIETYIKLNKDNNGRNNYLLKITNNRTKTRKESKEDKETSLARYKVMMVVNNILEDGSATEELVELRFTKRDCLMMLHIFRELLSSTNRMFNFASSTSPVIDNDSEIYSNEVVSVSKIDNSVVFGDVFLHGQELLNLAFLTEELIGSFGIENNLNVLFSNFRQVAVKPITNYLLGLEISKMDVFKKEDGEEVHEINENIPTKNLTLNNRLLVGLFLFTSATQLKHSIFLDKTRDEKKFGKKVLFHINLKESNIALGFTSKPEKKISKKTGDAFMSFFSISVSAKKLMYDQENFGYIKHYTQNSTEPTYVSAISKLSLNLHASWINFLEIMTKAANKEFDEGETIIKKRINIFSSEPGTKVKYSVSVYADNDNKAPVVFAIEKYEGEKEIITGKFRQPMFKKHLKQLLILAMQSAKELKDFSYEREKDLKDIVSVKYKDLNSGLLPIEEGNHVKIGIRKTAGETVTVGLILDKKQATELDYNDIVMLNTSCGHRIMHGNWLPFVGEKIAISQDGFLTDLFSEINLEERGQGVYNAWQYFFGTAIEK